MSLLLVMATRWTTVAVGTIQPGETHFADQICTIDQAIGGLAPSARKERPRQVGTEIVENLRATTSDPAQSGTAGELAPPPCRDGPVNDKMPSELGNRIIDVGLLRRRRQIADHHVVDHASAAQR